LEKTTKWWFFVLKPSNLELGFTIRPSHLYGDQGGCETLEKAGVVFVGDLTGPKARIFLMITLPQANGDRASLREYFINIDSGRITLVVRHFGKEIHL
jgi:hypothetical protein